MVESIESGKARVLVGDYYAEVLPSDIADLKGSFAYGTTIASAFLGHGSNGAIDALIANMQVDFDNGLIQDGSLSIQSGDHNWAVSFHGAIDASGLVLTALDGTLSNEFGIISDQINTSLNGVFTGNQAEAFLGGFDLLDATNSDNYIQGLFTLER